MSEKRIYNYLDQLLHKKICDIGRASNMLWVSIGENIIALDRKGNEVKKSTISLHVQSTWRIVNKEKKEILLASSDFYSPNSTVTADNEFEWDVQGNNLFDEKSQIWLNKNRLIYIKEYKVNRWGDLLLIFSNDNRLEIFINSSDSTECWRLFKHHSDEEHLVVTGLGVEFE